MRCQRVDQLISLTDQQGPRAMDGERRLRELSGSNANHRQSGAPRGAARAFRLGSAA